MYTGVIVNEKIQARLDQIFPKVTKEDFIFGRGLGNEIAFYIFDYLPEHEIEVRKHIDFMLKRIRTHTKLKVINVDLFRLIIDQLKLRGLLDKATELERNQGGNELWKALRAPLKPENLVKLFDEKVGPRGYDLVFVTGVGNAWPLIRSHSLLNNLQPVMGSTPLILFYPGRFDGQTVQLFGRLKSNPYYRAFQLIP